MLKKSIAAMSLLLIGSACSTTAPPIRDADASMVRQCQFLGTVSGSSGWGNILASVGMQNAQNEARANASQEGATDIVWTNIAGGFAPFATGNAYRCP